MGITDKQVQRMVRDAERRESERAKALTQAQALRAEIAALEADLRTKKAALAAYASGFGLKRSDLTPSADADKRTQTQASAVVYPDALADAKACKSQRKAFRNGWNNDTESHEKQQANLTTDAKREECAGWFAEGRASAERRVAQLEGAPIAV